MFGHFESRNFPSNQILPQKKNPGHEEIDTIIHNFGLKRTQAVRQLRSWKVTKFMIDEYVLTMSSVEISSSISDRLSISLEEIIEILPSKSKKTNDDSSGSSRLALAQSSDEIEMYLRKLTVFLFCANSNESETENELVNSVFTLLKKYSYILCYNYIRECPKNPWHARS